MNKISYALFLFHMVPISSVKEHFPSFELFWLSGLIQVLTYIVVMLFCYVLLKHVETPCNKYARRLTTIKKKGPEVTINL